MCVHYSGVSHHAVGQAEEPCTQGWVSVPSAQPWMWPQASLPAGCFEDRITCFLGDVYFFLITLCSCFESRNEFILIPVPSGGSSPRQRGKLTPEEIKPAMMQGCWVVLLRLAWHSTTALQRSPPSQPRALSISSNWAPDTQKMMSEQFSNHTREKQATPRLGQPLGWRQRLLPSLSPAFSLPSCLPPPETPPGCGS